MRAAFVVTGFALSLVLLLSSQRRKIPTVRTPRTSSEIHRRATTLAREAFESIIHSVPSRDELRMLLAVALHETTFGTGWGSEGADSNNVGAIQATSSWAGETFGGVDTHPTDTGGAVSYKQAFRKYPSALEGWQDLVRELYVRRGAVRIAAAAGDPRALAKAMRMTGYYEGQGATQAERIGKYEQALVNALWEIDHFGLVKS